MDKTINKSRLPQVINHGRKILKIMATTLQLFYFRLVLCLRFWHFLIPPPPPRHDPHLSIRDKGDEVCKQNFTYLCFVLLLIRILCYQIHYSILQIYAVTLSFFLRPFRDEERRLQAKFQLSIFCPSFNPYALLSD